MVNVIGLDQMTSIAQKGGELPCGVFHYFFSLSIDVMFVLVFTVNFLG